MMYQVNWTFEELPRSDDDTSRKDHCQNSGKLCEQLVHKGEDMFVASVSPKRMTVVSAVASKENGERLFERFRERLGVCVKNETCHELTFREFNRWLNSAERRQLIAADCAQRIRERYDLDALCGRYGNITLEERVVDHFAPIPKLIAEATERWLSPALAEELERIGQGFQGNTCVGHPVHYAVCADKESVSGALTECLIGALCQVGRLRSARVSRYVCADQNGFSLNLYEKLYKHAEGGVVEVVVSDEISRWHREDMLSGVAETACRYAARVLTVFLFPKNSKNNKAALLKCMSGLPLYSIREEALSGETARQYLRRRAREHKMRPDKQLYACCEESLTAPKLDRKFTEWYTLKLRRKVYPQYGGLSAVEAEGEKAPAEDAKQELSELIGLSEVKAVIERIVRFFMAQKRMGERGLVGSRPSMHMVFTGNPGTAKTTVARLLAKVLGQAGILKTERFYEVGRADLIGEYVGHTAPRVREAFAKARGGLLFIDEAYSLVDGRAGSFGDEAINTIVQEMENRRDDTIVVFAGYPEPMKAFLDRNAGLRSRIAFYVPFADYSAQELCQIASSIAARDGLTITEEATAKLFTLFEQMRMQTDFGNGRFARKIIEQARMAQVDRLMSMDESLLSDEMFTQLCAEDIVVTETQALPQKVRAIGFGG